MPNDPYDRKGWGPEVGQGHASGVLRLDHIACVTADIEAALHFFTGLCDGEVISDERIASPQPGRRVAIQLGDTRVAFIQPDNPGEGPLGAFLGKVQNGIYALVWQVEDGEKAKAHFTGKCSLRLTDRDCVSAGFAIEPEDFFGARHEFVVGQA